jgi:hypothetical protein
MAIPTGGLLSEIDFLNPACFTNGGTAVNDLSGNANDWTLENTNYTFDSTFGTLNLSANCSLQGIPLYTGNVPFTISYWIYFLSSNSDQFTFYNGGYPSNGWLEFHTKSVGEDTIRFVVNGGYNDAPLGSLINGQYNNVTVTYDGTTFYAYINNVLTNTVAGPINQGQGPTYPGFDFNNRYVNTGLSGLGLIYFYDNALNSTNRTQLYNDGLNRFNPPPTPLVELDFLNPACFPGSGTSITDLSGNNSNFTLNNTSYTYDPVIGALTLPSGTYADGIAADFVFGTNPVTINAWVKFNTSSPGINICKFGGDNPGERTQFYWRSSDNFIVSDNAGAAGGWVETADNEWHLLSLTRPSSSLCGQQNAYIDGVLITNNPANFYNPSQALNGSLGAARIHDSSDPLEIATFDVWDVEQTAGEILAYYNSTASRFAPVPPPSSNGVGGRQFAQGFNG